MLQTTSSTFLRSTSRLRPSFRRIANLNRQASSYTTVLTARASSRLPSKFIAPKSIRSVQIRSFSQTITMATDAKGGVHNLQTKSEWEKALEDNKDGVLVVDFFATWCGPCKIIAPHLVKLSNNQFQQATFVKVDVDQLAEVAAEQGIKAMPTFKIFAKGEVSAEVIGADPKKLEAKIAEAFKTVGWEPKA